MIGHFTDDPRVLEFINSNDLDRLAPMGTSCPGSFSADQNITIGIEPLRQMKIFRMLKE